MYKVALLSTASAIGLMASIGSASADSTFTGVGQIFLGAGTAEDSTFGPQTLDDPFVYGAKAKGYWALSPDVHLQVDLFARQIDDLAIGGEGGGEGGFPQTEATSFGGAAHLVHPFENRARFGFAGSIWSTDVFALGGSGQSDATYGLAALEAQFFGTDWTLTGQVGLFTTMSCELSGGEGGCPLSIEDGEFLRGKVRYFLSDNTALSLEANQFWGGLDDDIFSGKSLRADGSLWVLEGEHKFANSSFSGFLNVSHENTNVDSWVYVKASSDTTVVSAGIKFYLDQPTLRSNDKTGAEFDTPTFGHALEQTGAIAYAVSP